MIKSKENIFGKEVNMTFDEQLNKLKGKILAPIKLDLANKNLRKITALPK